jgi:hypothetical protein
MPNDKIKLERSKIHTGFAATFAVGAELSRRGYNVAFTMGNTPRIDLFCDVPNGESFSVQVKGLSGEYSFYISKKFFVAERQPNLFLVVVLVPRPGDNAPFRFFILTYEEAKREFDSRPTHMRDGRIYEDGSGFNWSNVKGYQNGWEKFPHLLTTTFEETGLGPSAQKT